MWPFFAFASRAKAAAFAVVPITVYSLLFMVCTQINHHADETQVRSPSGVSHANWYRHQAATSHDVVPRGRAHAAALFWATGGLNLQIEHHLFPCVNHWHLRALQPAVEAAARAHGVAYPRSHSLAEALAKLWAHLRVLAEPAAGGKHA